MIEQNELETEKRKKAMKVYKQKIGGKIKGRKISKK